MRSGRNRGGFTLIELMIVIAIIAILAAIGTVSYVRSRSRGQYTACISNVKNMGTANSMYSTDNGGRYATALTLLTTQYLKTIPSCPSAGYNTYTNGYTATSNPDAYTIVCVGSNHSGVGKSANYPQYTGSQGLIEQ